MCSKRALRATKRVAPFRRASANMNEWLGNRFRLKSVIREYFCRIDIRPQVVERLLEEVNMQITHYAKGSALGALAAAMILTTLPAEAHAQNRRGEDRSEVQRPQRAERGGQRQQAARQQEPRREARQEAAPRQMRAEPDNRGDERRGREWNRSDRRAEIAQERGSRDWNRSDRRTPRTIETTPVPASRVASSDQRNRSYRDSQRNGSYRDGSRSDRRDDRYERRESYRDGYRDGRYSDRREDRYERRESYRDGYRDGRHYDRDRDYNRGDYRRWSRHDWRRDNRYDWHDYRQHHRSHYRIGRYYSPYRYHRYSRISIGFYLDNLLFGSRYWINDPWDYRLPPAYGPYRWVRYYDDVLLVNIYSGEVVDVVYNFFW